MLATFAGHAPGLVDSAPAEPEPYSAKRLPAGRRALLHALPGLPPPRRAELERRLFPALTFSSRCGSCTTCAGVCPTGALGTDAGERPRAVFDASACTGCGLCVEFCRRTPPVLTASPRP